MKKILLLLTLVFITCGCVDTTPEQIILLKKGMSAKTVKCILGEPYSQVFETSGFMMRYVYDSGGGQEWLHVVIQDSVVVRWY